MDSRQRQCLAPSAVQSSTCHHKLTRTLTRASSTLPNISPHLCSRTPSGSSPIISSRSARAVSVLTWICTHAAQLLAFSLMFSSPASSPARTRLKTDAIQCKFPDTLRAPHTDGPGSLPLPPLSRSPAQPPNCARLPPSHPPNPPAVSQPPRRYVQQPPTRAATLSTAPSPPNSASMPFSPTRHDLVRQSRARRLSSSGFTVSSSGSHLRSLRGVRLQKTEPRQ